MVEPGAIAPGMESFSHTQLDFVTDDAFLELQIFHRYAESAWYASRHSTAGLCRGLKNIVSRSSVLAGMCVV